MLFEKHIKINDSYKIKTRLDVTKNLLNITCSSMCLKHIQCKFHLANFQKYKVANSVMGRRIDPS